MPSINFRIERAQRLVRMLDDDLPLLAVRVAPLAPEHRESTISYADMLRAKARVELENLLEQKRSTELADSAPNAAD
jgi:hypothetical protein